MPRLGWIQYNCGEPEGWSGVKLAEHCRTDWNWHRSTRAVDVGLR